VVDRRRHHAVTRRLSLGGMANGMAMRPDVPGLAPWGFYVPGLAPWGFYVPGLAPWGFYVPGLAPWGFYFHRTARMREQADLRASA